MASEPGIGGIRPPHPLPHPLLRNPLIGMFILTMLLFYALFGPRPSKPSQMYTLLFQSPLPQPTPTRPTTWIESARGGMRQSGPVTVFLPPRFTSQNGADVYVDVLLFPSGFQSAHRPIPGTEFTLGVWPPSAQVDYQRPIEIRVVLDASKVTPGSEDRLAIMMYRPDREEWEELPSQFQRGTFQIATSVQSLAPVPKDFPEWGGRTFFGVFERGEEAPPAAGRGPTVNRNANLRAGPGTNYGIVGGLRAGQSVELAARTEAGDWYQLRNGRWIAASLVDNAPELPVVTTTPEPPATATPTPEPQVEPAPSWLDVVRRAAAGILGRLR